MTIELTQEEIDFLKYLFEYVEYIGFLPSADQAELIESIKDKVT